ncbi:hypothetical protein HHK36_006837 [Tetracentron sinense]|uniref:S-adenosylmethionine-dependent methyltransferase n=1 Tax=Tetracentron sinense TaxID=13715 RepID=A0A835DPK8_TETSI|nr:hypothetical protein HHK36_006837 [Tetracentron sinense]
MEDKKANILPESCPMIGGNDSYNYAHNSRYQKGAVDAVKEMINEAIAQKLDIENLTLASLNPFRIADLGCSVGPNTFIAVQYIIEAIELKCQAQGLNSCTPEFQVFFNDLVTNDFNKLFASLPADRRYFAVGMPGSFYGRLFPKASLHFVHSSYALPRLSKVPEEVVDINSPAWNKEKIHYRTATKEVVEAYSAQYAKDMESFLSARAQELVCGGLMALVIATVPNGTLYSKDTMVELLGYCLREMANMGLISEAKVDSFNLPLYIPSHKELETVVERNGYFSIERMDPLNHQMKQTTPSVQMSVLHLRAGIGGLVKEHFGSEIIDEVFDRLTKKVAESSFILNPENRKEIDLFILLKRKSN